MGTGGTHGENTGGLACSAPLNPREITLDPDEVHALVEANFRSIRHCYEEKLDSNPSLHGVVRVQLFVDKRGRTTHVCSSDSTLPSQQVVKCVLHLFSLFRFAPRSVETASTYTVNFSPE